MEEEVFKVIVFEVSNISKVDNDYEPVDTRPRLEHEFGPINDTHVRLEQNNMISARVMQGHVVELEHSRLAGPDVKFKTVINFEKTLDPGATLGVALIPQDGYIAGHN